MNDARPHQRGDDLVAALAPDAPPIVQRMHEAFARSLARCPDEVREHRCAFAGRPISLRFVGNRLADRTYRAFAHLASDDAEAEPASLQVDLWDEAETGVPCPLDDAAMDLGQRWIACDGILTASLDGRYVGFRYDDSLTILDRHAQRMIGCRRSGSQLSRGECSKPFVVLLSVWYHDRGVQIFHAGLIARAGAGLLFPGESGTGKSTTSLASVVHGLEYLGDDFVGVERTEANALRGHSIYGTACLARDGLARFDEIRPHAIEDGFAGEEKPILFLAELFPDRLRRTVPIRAVVLLRVGVARTEIRKATRPEALRCFAASTLHTVVPRPGRAALQMIGDLVERVPAYWLLLGSDPRDIPPSVDHILTAAGGCDPL